MPLYRKNPIVIEAFQFTDKTKDRVQTWVRCNTACNFEGPRNEPCLDIQTLEGVMRVSLGDYVIKGINGEFYPCKADIFEKTYTLLGDEE